MSSGMAAANKEQPAGIRRNRMNFCGDGPTVRRTSGPIHIDTEERVAVWNAVAAYVQEQLLMHKGVWIPTFGSFDIISREITTANVTLQWPVFQLATNLVAMHGLQSHGESLPAYRKLEPLKRSQVAADASLSWHIVQASIQNTVFLISSCLKIGEKVAIVLKDIGVIFIDGMTFQMKFYYDFLQKLSGKENLRKAVLKAPWLMKMVMSRVAPVASLSPSGCLVVFPEFQMELVPKPPYLPRRKSSGSFPAERKLKEGDTLPPLAQGKRVRSARRPSFVRCLSTTSVDGEHLRRIRYLLQKESSKSRLLPEIQAVPKTPEQPVSCELRGQAGARNQDELGQARSTQRVRFRSEAENDHHEGAGLKVKTKTSHPRGILRKSPSSTEDSASSSRAESSQSTETKGRPSRLAFVAKDSFKLHKERMRRAQEEREEETEDRPSRPPLLSQDSFKLNKERMRRAKDEQEEEIKGRPSRRPFLAQDSFRLNKERMRRAQDEREEPAASTSHDDSSRSEGSSIDRSGWLPPIN